MKRILTLIICACFVTMLVGCSSELSTYKEISLKELYEKLDHQDSFILTIGSSECSHCASFQPKMETVIKVHQVKVYYVNAAKLSMKEYKDLVKKVNFSGTPTTIFFKKGKETSMSDRIEGDKDIEVIETKMRKNGYIK